MEREFEADRDVRLHDRRTEAYVDLAAISNRLVAYLYATYFDPLAPIEDPDEAETDALLARLDVVASVSVTEASKSFANKCKSPVPT